MQFAKTMKIASLALLGVALWAAPARAEVSEKIRKVQTALQEKGIDPGPIDGIIGPLTRKAVKAFQEQNGLTASGNPDSATLAKLGIGKAAESTTAEATEAPAGGKNPPVPFPKGFREWHHVKSMIIYSNTHPLFDPFGGIHHVYVNDVGIGALKAKKPEFPNGTVFVFDLLEADQSGGAVTEGKRKFTAAMVRNTNKYKDSEGWGWQVWEGGDPTKTAVKEAAAARACATCHKEVSTKQFVFTEYRP